MIIWGVDIEKVWNVVKNNLPELKNRVMRSIQELEEKL